MKQQPIVLPLAALLCAAAASYLKPPILPLAVRNPYLSLWYNAREAPWETWPMFWTGDNVGLGIMARLPSNRTVYPLLGRTQDDLLLAVADGTYNYSEPIFQGFQFDSHSTTLSYSLGTTVNVVLHFSSPITGESIMRQSLPASYLEIKVEGTEDVEIYLDVNGMWVTHDASAAVQWDFQKSSTLQSWAVSRQTQLLFTENQDRGEWGTFYFSAPEGSSITYQSSSSASVRKGFADGGVLQNSYDTNFRGSLDDEPVFAFAKTFSLGNGKATNSSTLFTLALVQDLVVQYAGKDGYIAKKPLWAQYYGSDIAMLAFHYDDYGKVSASASEFSRMVGKEAKELVDDTYADIVALSARQVLGATSFSGTIQDPIIFLKEISSNGNFQTVDVIFPALPFFLYLNPDWLAYILEPLLEHQLAGFYPNYYSMHDLGAHFPNATGHPDGKDEAMPVEECGNMLIMALAYAQSLNSTSGSTAAKEWVNRNGRYSLWKQWTQFLIENSLVPEMQLSTDDFAGRLANQTNLALKGIIGIRAMSQLALFMGNTAEAEMYRTISDGYIPQWQELAVSRDRSHTKLAYHWEGSWGSLYNAYADALLCFHVDDSAVFLPHSVYRNQSDWYHLVHQQYGLPLDSRHLYTKSDWGLWIAAISSDETRAGIVDAIGRWVNDTQTNGPFVDLYDTESGKFPAIYFKARPVVGGHFSMLALDRACAGRGLEGIRKVFSEIKSETIGFAGQDPLFVEDVRRVRVGNRYTYD